MTDTATNAPAPGTSTPTGAANVAEAAALAAAAPAAPAPAQAPAAPAAPEAKSDYVPAKGLGLAAESDDKGKQGYAPTGHKNLDASLAFMGKHGFGPDHAAMQEAMNGNFALLRAEMAEKGVAGGEAYIMLAEKAHEELVAKHEEKRTKDRADLFGMVGGEEQWKEVVKWGKENASPEQTEVLQSMLNKGGIEMQIAASWLANGFTKATGGVPETDGAGARVADVRGAPVMTSDALSPSDYGRAVAEASRKHTDRRVPFDQSDAYNKLAERRSRWRG